MNEPATKADLNLLRTDVNLLGDQLRQELASKTDLHNGLNLLETRLRQELVSKSDFERFAINVTLEFAKTNSRTDALREEMRDGFRQMTGRFDAFIGKLETYERETKTIPKTLDQHGEDIRNHEIRLRALESERPN